MSIDLPSLPDVRQAIAQWRGRDQRLATLLARYDAEAPALRHYGLVLWEDGHIEAATQALSGAVALRPEEIGAWTDLANVLCAGGRPNEAASCLEQAVTRDPSQAAPWLRLGAVRNDLGQTAGAIDAYKAGLALDRSSADGWFGLGLLYFAEKRHGEAADALREAAARKPDDAVAHACLGESLYVVGDFVPAAAAFGKATRLQPDNRAIRFKYFQARFITQMMAGGMNEALAALDEAPLDKSDIDKIMQDGFHLLSGFGHRDAAIALGECRLTRAPDDKMQRYLLAALRGETLARAPDAYVVSFFDRFAENFDHQLVDRLAYSAPADLAAMIERHAARDPGNQAGDPCARTLDLGCGTGLAGSKLARPGRALTGVDLSPGMLGKARARGVYDRLIESEIMTFLADERSAPYDLVVAADVLIYFGDLEPLFREVTRVLTIDGLWAFSIETTDKASLLLQTSGRFAHAKSYISDLAQTTGMAVLEVVDTIIRFEANRPVNGALFVLKRR